MIIQRAWFMARISHYIEVIRLRRQTVASSSAETFYNMPDVAWLFARSWSYGVRLVGRSVDVKSEGEARLQRRRNCSTSGLAAHVRGLAWRWRLRLSTLRFVFLQH